MRRIALYVAATLLISSSAFGQLQQCPGVDPNDCWDEYSTCYSDNEGKNCDWRTCAEYCDKQYNECMYGMQGYTWWENPVISRTVDTSINDGEDIGCVAGCTAWGCLCMDSWVAYRRYHTDWQRVQKQNRSCAGGYSYVDTLQVINQYDDLCYQHDDSCTAWERHQDCMSQSPCTFTADGTAIAIP